jgi:hypothetical protein|tara:strand:- start:1546 stop:2319 length:774 start_codon:yes stop_codon:yes gene_type:complete
MAKPTGISEAKIRQAIWMLKAKKTKKQVCEHLGIAYNTKRLDNIIQEFHNNIDREAELKKKARLKKFTLEEKQGIADSYLNGDTQSGLAKQFYISPQRIKNILIEMNVPIRARGKGKAANVEHVVQDLEVRFKKGDKVFLAKENTFATVKEVYDEDWLELHEQGHQKYIEIVPFKPGSNGMAGRYSEPTEGVHYEIYWMLEGEVLPTRKLSAFLHKRNNVSKIIEETGRESYLLYRQGDHGGYINATRDQLFPVKAA